MADNTILNAGAGGDTLATDDLGGVKIQRVKVEFGADGASARVVTGTGLPVTPTPQASGGCSSKSFATAASDNATSLKASAGQLYGVHVFNAAVYPIFVKIYNKASAPAPATDNALLVRRIGVQAGTQRDVEFPLGIACGTGIAYAVVKGVSDTDDTAVAANDALVDLEYL